MKPNLILLFCTLAFFYVDGLAVAQQRQPAKKVAAKPVALRPAPYINIVAVGDIMMGTAYPNAVTLPPDSGRKSFKAIEKYLKNTDVAFGNLEGTLIDTGAPAHYKLHLKSKAYLFRSPVYYGGILKQAGFNLLSIANNHASDFGDAGRASTVKTLDHYGIHYAGSDDFPTTEFTVKGIRYGFCAFAPNAHTNSILDLKKAALFIRNLKQHCDIVIVSFHGGGEGGAFEHVRRKNESYFGEKRGDVYKFAHNAIDAGADLVLGHGPHVTRAMELYKDRFIAYSLGNFCTYKSVSIQGVNGIAPLLRVRLRKTGEFMSGQIVSIKQDHTRGLEADTLNRAALKVKQLIAVDFPENVLNIAADGSITAPIKAAGAGMN